jgi:hypothetical protein
MAILNLEAFVQLPKAPKEKSMYPDIIAPFSEIIWSVHITGTSYTAGKGSMH